jgi:hypothetical protein
MQIALPIWRGAILGIDLAADGRHKVRRSGKGDSGGDARYLICLPCGPVPAQPQNNGRWVNPSQPVVSCSGALGEDSKSLVEQHEDGGFFWRKLGQ